MLKDGLKLTGKLKIAINGNTVQEIPNLVVTDGKEFVASRMKDATATVMSHMAIGTGTTSAVATNTTLETELSGSRTALTSTTVSSNDIIYVATFAAGVGTGAVTEAGIFNASSGGTMLCRTVFAVVNKAAADAMTVTWTVTVS